MRKAFASFLFHLNQSAHEFFFELHEVGSIYVDASVFVDTRTAYAGSSESLEVLWVCACEWRVEWVSLEN